MDNQYYQKNAQLRYHISKELKFYHKKIELDEKNKINPFIIPLFSATVTISTAIASFLARKTDSELFIYFCVPILAGLSFFVFYSILKWIITPQYNRLIKCIRNKSVKNKPLSCNNDNDLVNKFNFDVVHLIYLAYNLTYISKESDRRIIQFNDIEAIFYLNRALNKLKAIFIQHVFNTAKEFLPIYKIKIATDMLKESLIVLEEKYKETDTDIYLDVTNLKISYNSVIVEINHIYNSNLK